MTTREVKMILQRNYSQEGMRTVRQWYTAEFAGGLVFIHVWSDNNQPWQFKITAANTWKSESGYPSRDTAYMAAAQFLNEKLNRVSRQLADEMAVE